VNRIDGKVVEVGSAIGGVPLVLRGHNVTAAARGVPNARSPPEPWRPMEPDEVGWEPQTTTAAFSAIGCTRPTEEGLQDLIHIAVEKQVTINELSDVLITAGVWDAVLLGGSADVQQWIDGQVTIYAASRATTTNPGNRRNLNAILAISPR